MKGGTPHAESSTIGAHNGSDSEGRGRGHRGDPKAALVKLGIQRVIEEALEAVVRETIGRDYYARRPVGAQGYRNGTRPGRLATSEGEVRYAVPPVRDVPPRCCARCTNGSKGAPLHSSG